MKQQQQGFTLIELIVVIVILGILAATALPKFADLQHDARVAKMQGAAAALKSGAALFHSTWLVKGSPTAAAVQLDGVNIPYQSGYPDVGGDGPAANAATTAASSGAYLAAGLGGTDYTSSATATVLTLTPDTTHAACAVTYTESGGSFPVVDATAVTVANC